MGAKRPLVVSIVGTRPEAIKMRPVAHAFAARGGLDHRVILTGQHRDLEAMFDGLPVQALRYDPAGRTPVKLRESLHGALYRNFARERPDFVLVQGDTASALAGAFAARDRAIPIGHVEAGLRSFDFSQPWPEEGNRVAIDAMADLLFAPTRAAMRNLAADFRATGAVHLTGNSGIDALFAVTGGAPPAAPRAPGRARTILVTCHRKENQGDRLDAICTALKRLVADLPVEVVLPLHVNPHQRRRLATLLVDTRGIALLPPQDYQEMVRLIAASWLVLTDSGGLQEEAPALGKPVLVLREKTERAEAEDSLELVGADPDRICAAVARLLAEPERYRRMARPNLAFGDGRASPRIARAVDAFLRGRRPRDAARAPFSPRIP